MNRSLFAALVAAGLAYPSPLSAEAPSLLATWTMCGVYPLARPWHLAFDAGGNVHVADLAEHRVFVFSNTGGYVTSWTCPALDPLDFGPCGIAVSADGHAYVTTPYPTGPAPFYLTAYTTAGDYLGPVGTLGSGPGQLGKAMDVAVDRSGHLYVMDWANFRIDVLTSDGGYVTQWGSHGSGPGQLAGPWGIALDGAGNVYVADAANNRIQVSTGAGEFLTQWGMLGSGPGRFYKPIGVGVGPDGRVYVADTWNRRIQVFGSMPTPARTKSWGAFKARFR